MQAPQPQAAPIQIAGGAPTAGTAEQIYLGLRKQQDVLRQQLSNLEDKKSDLVQELARMREAKEGTSGPIVAGIEERVKSLDAQISDLDKQIAVANAAVAKAAAVPGAVVERPAPPRNGPPDEVYVLAGIFMFVVLLPMSIAFARRIWRRSAKATVVLPPELGDRMASLERAVDAIAVEVERIGEGQRFVTQVMTDAPRGLGAGQGAAEPIPVKARAETA
jgi:cell division protein FtsB